MARISLAPLPPLGGADMSMGQNRIRERGDLALVSVATPLGGEQPLNDACQAAWGIDLPGPTRATAKGEMRAVRMTQDQIMLIFPHSGVDEAGQVAAGIGGAGYVTLQTDAWVRLEISGPQTLPALERLCPLDLSLPAFPCDASARTVMEHMGALILRLEAERFWLMSASSSARSFLHAIETSYRSVLM